MSLLSLNQRRQGTKEIQTAWHKRHITDI